MNSTLIKNITLIGVVNGEVIENTSIAIENGKIKEFGSDVSQNSSSYSHVIDCEDGFLMPGFVDAHVHLLANGFRNEDYMRDPLSYYFYKGLNAAKLTLEAGITTVRDCGLADYGFKLAAAEKLFPSPKIQISVMPLSITGGHFDVTLKSGHDMIVKYPGLPHPICNGVEGVIAKTREVARAGADFIKVMATGGTTSANDKTDDIQFNIKELKAIVDEADRLDRKVATHCHGHGGLELSIKAGVHSIEHGTSVDKKNAKLMIDKNIFLVPTFSVMKNQEIAAKNRTLQENKIEGTLKLVEIHKENIELAYNQGVTMAMGTDSGVQEHGDNLGELDYFVKMGMSPLEAIITGTLNSAKCLAVEDSVGSIEVGKNADLVFTKKNPLDDISILKNRNNILMVFQDGFVVKNLIGIP
ncbi:MAG: amidohydrolase family protein [Methanobrevibacter sp.]|jgi:imidazolonepropionase-like amidohydrolase|nr:amidohydrolase family protein [Candidatus Methanovirga aequatorialis]